MGRKAPIWNSVHEENVAKALHPPSNLDVVFLGDQFVQAWTGKFVNVPTKGGTEVQNLFNRTFQRANGGMVDGIALGIAGDTTSNLLWRIKNGEMPVSLNPKGTLARTVQGVRRTPQREDKHRLLITFCVFIIYLKCGGFISARMTWW